MRTTNVTLSARPSWLGKRGYGTIVLFLSPALIIVAIFYVAPVILTVVKALTDLDWQFQWDWYGLGNFHRMLDDFLLPGFLWVTLLYVFFTLSIFNVGLALILALVLTSVGERTGTFFRSLWLLPRFTPPIVYGVIWMWIIDPTRHGLLNSLGEAMGFLPLDWVFSHHMAIIIIVNGLIGTSLGMLIFTAAIRSIPRELHWAAEVDGAGWLQDIRHIIIPQIRWPLLFITAFQTLSLLTSFEYILIVTRGGPFFASTVWSLYAYKLAFGGYFAPFQFGYGAAMALVLVVIGAGASLIYWRVFRFRSMIAEPRIEVV